VEQKNWSVVRKLLGYGRYESQEALVHLKAGYELLRVWTNHWQPTLKLIGKQREGAKVRKRYDLARTPYRRVRAAVELGEEAQARLQQEHDAWGPVALWRACEAACERLWRLQVRSSGGTSQTSMPTGDEGHAA
jgi:hypothetical protein